MPRHSVPLGKDRSNEYTRYITPKYDDLNPTAFVHCRKPLSDRMPSELRPDMITCFFHEKAIMSVDDLRNQWGGIHVERLAEPIERTFD